MSQTPDPQTNQSDQQDDPSIDALSTLAYYQIDEDEDEGLSNDDYDILNAYDELHPGEGLPPSGWAEANVEAIEAYRQSQRQKQQAMIAERNAALAQRDASPLFGGPGSIQGHPPFPRKAPEDRREVRMISYVRASDKKQLQELAEQEGVSLSILVNRALHRYLKDDRPGF